MSSIGQPITGERASTPKICRISGDDRATLVYRNLGNNHSMPYIWADTITVASGTTSAVVASGIKFHGYTLASYGKFVATPEGDLGSFYINKDEANNIVTFMCSSAATEDTPVTINGMLGVAPDLASLSCKGNTGAQPALP